MESEQRQYPNTNKDKDISDGEDPEIIVNNYEFHLDGELKCKVKLTKEIHKKVDEADDGENEIEIFDYKISIDWSINSGDNIVLHWGSYKRPKVGDWLSPLDSMLPQGVDSKRNDTQSADSPFTNSQLKMEFVLSSSEGTTTNYPHGINFVFHNCSIEKWYNNNGSNYTFEIIPRPKVKYSDDDSEVIIPDYIQEGLNLEGSDCSWGWMYRYQRIRESLFQWDIKNHREAIWPYLWLKYSFRKLLPWQRHFNTPPKDLQWSMHILTFELTKRFAEFAKQPRKDKKFVISPQTLMKQGVVTVGKGRSNGQLIRDKIWDIFHKFLIPEKTDSFYEQWHQKLHNNTSPEDIVICQALVNFLRSGNIADYHNTLNGGGVSWERWQSFDRKINWEPYYAPQYLPDFEEYLHILKEVHGSVDIVLMYDQCKYAIQYKHEWFNEIIYFKDDWDTMKQIWRVTNGREELNNCIMGNLDDHGKLRDLIFFDSSLELYLRQIIEKIIHLNMDLDLYINEVTAILKNIRISYNNYEEINIVFTDWCEIAEKLKIEAKNGNGDAAMKIKSVSDRIMRLLGNVTDYYNNCLGPRAVLFGEGCKVDKYHVNMFAEEEIRGSVFFAWSVVMKKIDPILRQKANWGPWLIISRGDKGKVNGKVRFEKDLKNVQMETFKERTVLLTENVGGNEEIPQNCSCVVIVNSNNYPDILAHVSVRARNLQVPFVVCFDGGICKDLTDKNEKYLEVKIVNQNIEYSQIDVIDSNEPSGNEETKKIEPGKINESFASPYIELEEFNQLSVGAKSNNTLRVYNKLPPSVKYPESFAIPFSVNEYFLSCPENSKVKEKLDKLITKLSEIKTSQWTKVRKLLEQCKEETLKLVFPQTDENTVKLSKRLVSFGIEQDKIELAFTSIKKVWASKFNERAFIALNKVGIKPNQISMAVWCQKIIPSDYAFVIHTKNPSNDNKNEVYCEVVYGMGESLVGSYEGQSLSFVFNKDTKQCSIKTYPNKSIALLNNGFIFRSDSNTEDLEGFAGAGWFDSVPMSEDRELNMGYHMNQLFNDGKFWWDLMKRIAELGWEVEKLYNGEPQDIEGCYSKGEIYIIQTRPQV